MNNGVIVGINWGDEGKGRMVDLLTDHYDLVVRYQGGGNAGHTVVNEKGKFALHLLPSGIFRPGVVNVLGNGVALDPENLWLEMEDVRSKGVAISPDNLKISSRASLLLPWHRELDGLEEARLADKQYGSTKQGIAPFYSDKYQKKTALAGELFHPEELREHLAELLEWKNLTLTRVYGAEPWTLDKLEAWVFDFGEKLKPYICDTHILLRDADRAGKRILFEAQLGALRDIGVVKAYSTCVGEGPFVCEMFGEEAEKLREAGAEYGAKTGRPRRVGPMDLVATRYGVEVQGATELALTKLDVLSDMETIPVCVRYQTAQGETDDFLFPTLLASAKPVIEYVPGWKSDISGARRWDDLPKAAQDYVNLIQNAVGAPITYISVGPERDSYIHREG